MFQGWKTINGTRKLKNEQLDLFSRCSSNLSFTLLFSLQASKVHLFSLSHIKHLLYTDVCGFDLADI